MAAVPPPAAAVGRNAASDVAKEYRDILRRVAAVPESLPIGASHNDKSDDYLRIVQFHAGQAVYLAKKLEAMPEGDSNVLDNSLLMFLSNMWSGSRHDSTKVPVVQIGGLQGTLETGRVLDYSEKGDENRKLCSMYLSIMDRMGVHLDKFGDAETRLAEL